MKNETCSQVRSLVRRALDVTRLARGDAIELGDLLLEVGMEPASADRATHQEGDLQAFLERATADRIRTVLKEVRGARLEAARRLGIDRTTLYRLMRKYGITSEEGGKG